MVILDAGKLMSRALFASPQLKFYQSFLLGHVNKLIFYENVMEFQSKYMRSPKYKESFTVHVPHGFIALGKFLIELPNFSQKA